MEILAVIATALIQHGGLWGVAVAALFGWNIYREKSTEKRISSSEMREDYESYAKKEAILKEEVSELQKKIINLEEENKKLLYNIHQKENERIMDLKEMLSDYHMIASDTLQALKKFEFFIVNIGIKQND